MEWTKSLDITLTLDGPFAVVEIEDTSSGDHVRYDFRYDEAGRSDINNMRDASFRIGQEIMDWFALLLEWRDDEEQEVTE